MPAVWTRTWGARVIATGPQARTSFPVEVDTHVTGLLVHAGGALTTSFETVKPGQPWLEVHGSEGSLAAPDPNGFDSPVLISGKGAQWQPVPDRPVTAVETLLRSAADGNCAEVGQQCSVPPLVPLTDVTGSRVAAR